MSALSEGSQGRRQAGHTRKHAKADSQGNRAIRPPEGKFFYIQVDLSHEQWNTFRLLDEDYRDLWSRFCLTAILGKDKYETMSGPNYILKFSLMLTVGQFNGGSFSRLSRAHCEEVRTKF